MTKRSSGKPRAMRDGPKDDPKVGETWWIQGKGKKRPTELGRVEQVNDHWYTVLLFHRIGPENGLAKWEWIPSTCACKRRKQDFLYDAAMLPFENFNALPHAQRRQYMSYRELNDEGFKAEYCRCGCKEPVNLNLGYAYCNSCKGTTKDAHLAGNGSIHESYLRETDGSIILVNKLSNEPELAKCSCGNHFASPVSNTTPSSTPRHSLYIVIDVGTRGIRIQCSYNGGSFGLLHEYPSSIYIPSNGSLPSFGKEMTGGEGEHIFAMKRLVFPDKTTAEILSRNNLNGVELYREGIRDIILRYIEEHPKRSFPLPNMSRPDEPSEQSLFDFINLDQFEPSEVDRLTTTICSAYPCALDQEQRSEFTNGLQLDEETKVYVEPEPVAALRSWFTHQASSPTTERCETRLGKVACMDAGATSIDVAVVRVKSLNSSGITVEDDFGFPYGQDDAELATAKYLQNISKRDAADCLKAVRDYGDLVKQGKPAGDTVRRYGVDIVDEYTKSRLAYLERFREDLEKHMHRMRDIDLIVLCGGGGRDNELKTIVSTLFPKVTLTFIDESNKTSHVLHGLKVALQPPNLRTYSPVTICIKQDKPHQSRRREQELVILTRLDQAAQDPKLWYGQQEPVIVFDTTLGEGDAKLAFMGSFQQDLSLNVNERGLLIVDPDCDHQSFYNIAEVAISRTEWAKAKLPKSTPNALTIMRVMPDITTGVLNCEIFLIHRPKSVEEMGNFCWQDFKTNLEAGKYIKVCHVHLNAVLNLNESKREVGKIL